MDQISSILSFQVEKRLFGLCKKSLDELDKIKIYALKLEKLLKHLEFEDKEFFMSNNICNDARKQILDVANDSKRELNDLMEKFDIKLK